MLFYADLHIHTKYSRATSKNCCLEELALWADKKGLSIISTGDFTHPEQFREIKEKLVPAGEGTFKLKEGSSKARFVLSVEISTIYKKWDKTRKVHHVIFAPDLNSAQKFREKLGAIGNINSDGRPILGLDSRDLLECALECSQEMALIPAHIWTPWFSVLGSKSGFDSIEDCYGDLAGHIFALETGLSSDPMMNWRVSKLDKYRLVSNSDAHSPAKLAREATVFNGKPDYPGIMNALKTGYGYVGTVEFFPEEGKYHQDGHRKCNICLSPEESRELHNICPICKKPLTIGVNNRVCELADRTPDSTFIPETAGKVFSLVPLPEILSEIMQVGVSSKSVVFEYEKLLHKFGSELSILQDIPTDEISKSYPLLAEGILRLREGRVIKQPGFDGEYGVIRLFEKEELEQKKYMNLKLDIKLPKTQEKEKIKYQIPTDETKPKKEEVKNFGLDEHQKEAVENNARQLLIIAGPGSGKTTVLTRRIAYMVNNKGFKDCLAITFTRRAALEMEQRLEKLGINGVNIHTFHSFCFEVLKENYQKAGLDKDFKVISEQERALYGEQEENTIEFDDLIKLTVKLFENYPQTIKRYEYISIDEYQDIDENQYKLIKLLTGNDGVICAIGDPNQAIYGFRGGSSKFFNNFTNDYKNALCVNLVNNYRSTKEIVNASNQMIGSFNTTSAKNATCEKITIHKAASEKAEAEYIISTIENLIGGHSLFSIDSSRSQGYNENLSFGDFAILYRTQTQLKPIIEALEQSAMPYVKLSDDLLCTNKAIRELLKTLNDRENIEEQIAKAKGIEDYILKFLLNIAQKYPKKEDFIHNVSLLRESDALDKRADRISLMTLHCSKGLEFNCVFIAGLEEGTLPLFRAKTKEEIEEERRLLYVGMTRAKQRLFLTRAEKRRHMGKLETPAQSHFLDKIEQDLLETSEFKAKYKDSCKQLTLF